MGILELLGVGTSSGPDEDIDTQGTEPNESEKPTELTGKSNAGTFQLATPRIEFNGSVHSRGTVDVTVKRLHTAEMGGDSKETHLGIDPSPHEGGSESLTVEETMMLEHGDIPSPTGSYDISREFKNSKFDESGSAWDSVEHEVMIDSLVIMPSLKRNNWFSEPMPHVIEPLADAGYDCYSEVSFKASVHRTGTLKVVIDDLYIYPDLPASREQIDVDRISRR